MGRFPLGDGTCLQAYDQYRNNKEADYRAELNGSCLKIHPKILYIKVQDPGHDREGGLYIVSLQT